MNKITFSFLMMFWVFLGVQAQEYTSPNTGVTLGLDDIAAASPSTITYAGSEYSMWESITISESDTLLIDTDLTLAIDAGLRITIFGTFLVTADAVTFTAIDQENPYDGFRFEEFSVVNIQNSTIEYGGGLRVLNEDFTINNCTLSNNVSGISTGSVISLSRGAPQITNNTFLYNVTPAVSSAANRQVSAYIFNNYMEGNNTDNSNRPQINMGTTMATDTLKIIQNTIIGDPANTRAGGIAVANLTGGQVLAIIDDNIIQGNRYGITVVGANAFAYVRNNIIEDNNTEGNPSLGGSGISINTNAGSHYVVASGNEIRRNLWGITVIGQAQINLGDDEDNPGGNIFSENGNGGITYALYNNTPHEIMAKHNCWIEGEESTVEDVEEVIFHQPDDASLGEVIYEPFLCGVTVGIEDKSITDFGFYPNPVTNEIHFNNTFSFEKLEIYGVQGNLISSQEISGGNQNISIHLPAGVYFATFVNSSSSVVKKMIVR